MPSASNDNQHNDTNLAPAAREHLAVLALQAEGCFNLSECLIRSGQDLERRLRQSPELASSANRELLTTIAQLAEHLGLLGGELTRLANAREDFSDHLQRVLGRLRVTDRLLALAALSETLRTGTTSPKS